VGFSYDFIIGDMQRYQLGALFFFAKNEKVSVNDPGLRRKGLNLGFGNTNGFPKVLNNDKIKRV